ncbi:MAG TPA: TonB family protein [Bryobacteraceae bacterium]|nr:TonB family protein [Bryobacteraceae bacterium]
MFEQTILAGSGKTRRAWTVPVCFAGQLAAVGCLVLMPLIFFEGLPQGQLAPPRLTVPGTYRPKPLEHVQLVSTGSHAVSRGLVPPMTIPHGIHLGPDVPAAPPDLEPECTGACVPDSVGPGVPVWSTRVLPIAPEPQRTEIVRPIVRATPKPTPIPISSGVQEAKLIHRVTPVYPPQAIKLRISGAVHLAAIIGADGRIRELQVLGGHPFLVQAAVNAVREWVYLPTMLNGAPVEVMTDITVTFYLK